MLDIITQTKIIDNIVFYSIILFMYMDAFITYVVLSKYSKIIKDWHNHEMSWIHRPIMKKLGFRGWGWFVVCFQPILYLGIFFYLQHLRNFDVAIRLYYFMAGVYVITLMGNFAMNKQIDKHPKYIKYLERTQKQS